MDTLNKLAAPASEKLRQLQKMVQDIKKNDGSILDRLRRLKGKPAPKVPVRDYQGDVVDGDQWSETEFESDTYEDPHEDQDDSYEPPPSHRVFTTTPSVSFPRGDYIDSCPRRPNNPPRKPLRPLKTKPKPLMPLPNQMAKTANDEDDYINPESDIDDDNYIDPTEKGPPNPLMHGRARGVSRTLMSKTVPERPHSPDVYEVPDMTEENSPQANRMHMKKLPPTPVQEPTEDDEYEVCDPDESRSVEQPVPAVPKPLPRETKPVKPLFRLAPDITPREHKGQTLSMSHSSQKPVATAQPSEFKRAKIPLLQMFTSQKLADCGATNGPTDAEEVADVLKKPWYASTCDRKTAEDALIRSNKDGSFLVRKSSGQDTQQPFTLVVFYNSRVYNIPVRYIQASQQYALGREKKGEERFSSVSHIIENHQKNRLLLIDSQSNTKDSTKLSYAVKP